MLYPGKCNLFKICIISHLREKIFKNIQFLVAY